MTRLLDLIQETEHSRNVNPNDLERARLNREMEYLRGDLEAARAEEAELTKRLAGSQPTDQWNTRRWRRLAYVALIPAAFYVVIVAIQRSSPILARERTGIVAAPSPIPTSEGEGIETDATNVIPLRTEKLEAIQPFVFCSASAMPWVTGALQEFSREQGEPPRREVLPYEARDGKQVILFGQKISVRLGKGTSAFAIGRPLIYIVDDPYWTTKLNRDRASASTAGVKVPAAVKRLVPQNNLHVARTRLVFVMRVDKARLFEAAIMGRGSYSGRPWLLLHDLTSNQGWGVLTQSPDVETCHLLVPSPVHHHAGLAALSLAYAEYMANSSIAGLGLSDSDLNRYLRRFAEASIRSEEALVPTGLNLATLSTNDIAIMYEADAFQLLHPLPGQERLSKAKRQEFRIVYPSVTLEAMLVAAPLDDINRTPAELQSQTFAQFLTRDSVQRTAMAYGYHPSVNKATIGAQTFADAESITAGFRASPPTILLWEERGGRGNVGIRNGTNVMLMDPDVLTYLPRMWNDFTLAQGGPTGQGRGGVK